MKIRDKITVQTIIVIVLVSVLSGLIISFIINANFQNFLNTQIEFIDMNEMGPRVRRALEQLQGYRNLVDEFNRNIFITTIITTLFGIGLSVPIAIFLSNKIVEPIKRLIGDVRNMRTHDYSTKVVVSGNDEVAELAINFDELREELLRVEELRKDLVSDLAHEISTPLTSIRGIVEGSIDGVYDPKEKLSSILEELDILDDLTKRLRHFNEIRTREYSENKEKVEIIEELQNISDKFSKNYNRDVNLEINEKEISARINKLGFNEVMNNLVSNAIKYSTDEIVIGVQRNESEVVIKVVDQGDGISVEDQKLIFERFYRVDKSRNKKSGGIGLGLAIVKELCEVNGWDIRVNSEPKKGTEFELCIPR